MPESAPISRVEGIAPDRGPATRRPNCRPTAARRQTRRRPPALRAASRIPARPAAPDSRPDRPLDSISDMMQVPQPADGNVCSAGVADKLVGRSHRRRKSVRTAARRPCRRQCLRRRACRQIRRPRWRQPGRCREPGTMVVRRVWIRREPSRRGGLPASIVRGRTSGLRARTECASSEVPERRPHSAHHHGAGGTLATPRSQTRSSAPSRAPTIVSAVSRADPSGTPAAGRAATAKSPASRCVS